MTDAPYLFRLFVYASYLPGERNEAILEGGELEGEGETPVGYALHEVGPDGALVAHGDATVRGLVFKVPYEVLSRADKHAEHPVLYHRIQIRLADDSEVETYAMHRHQVRGRRKIKGGDWRARLAPDARSREDAPLVRWAKRRWET